MKRSFVIYSIMWNAEFEVFLLLLLLLLLLLSLLLLLLSLLLLLLLLFLLLLLLFYHPKFSKRDTGDMGGLRRLRNEGVPYAKVCSVD